MSDNNFNPLDRYSGQTITVAQNALRTATGQYDTAKPDSENAKIDHACEIIFIVRGMSERVLLQQHNEIKLGRFEPAERLDNTLDLTPYGAADRGVSRFHARIHIEENQVFITDMNSTNGTYIEGIKLNPDTPTPLHKGDKLVLGRLPIQVMLR